VELIEKQIPSFDWIFIYILLILVGAVFLNRNSVLQVVQGRISTLFFLEPIDKKKHFSISTFTQVLLYINVIFTWVLLSNYFLKFNFNQLLWLTLGMIILVFGKLLLIQFVGYIFEEEKQSKRAIFYHKYFDIASYFITFICLLFLWVMPLEIQSSKVFLFILLFFYIFVKIRSIIEFYIKTKLQVTYIFLYLCALEIFPLLWVWYISRELT
jgi:hypothetical protein